MNKNVKKILIVVGFVFLFPIVCSVVFQAVFRSHRASLPPSLREHLPEWAIKTQGKILVLPLWERSPFYYDERQDKTLYLGKPITLHANQLEDIDSMIHLPFEIIVYMGLFQIGIDHDFIGLYLLFSNGQVLWLESNPIDLPWKPVKQAWINGKWISNLKNIFLQGKSIMVHSQLDSSFWGMLHWAEGRSWICNISLSNEDREKVLQFLNVMKESTSSEDSGHWRRIKQS